VTISQCNAPRPRPGRTLKTFASRTAANAERGAGDLGQVGLAERVDRSLAQGNKPRAREPRAPREPPAANEWWEKHQRLIRSRTPERPAARRMNIVVTRGDGHNREGARARRPGWLGPPGPALSRRAGGPLILGHVRRGGAKPSFSTSMRYAFPASMVEISRRPELLHKTILQA